MKAPTSAFAFKTLRLLTIRLLLAYSNCPLLQVFPFDNFLVDNTYYMIYVGLMGDLR